ncbi:hypothetical protein PVAP13_7KG020509 [Panicum virgatum]|uniref:Uncharacterized protein n=1 Tax=Panicum virgatum TaxID=38727 RepID=A0A8T0QB38_PANVG|nr:hypothetical protein PVAP13_7KG020509 [Panicum virgatum]
MCPVRLRLQSQNRILEEQSVWSLFPLFLTSLSLPFAASEFHANLKPSRPPRLTNRSSIDLYIGSYEFLRGSADVRDEIATHERSAVELCRIRRGLGMPQDSSTK